MEWVRGSAALGRDGLATERRRTSSSPARPAASTWSSEALKAPTEREYISVKDRRSPIHPPLRFLLPLAWRVVATPLAPDRGRPRVVERRAEHAREMQRRVIPRLLTSRGETFYGAPGAGGGAGGAGY